ncbi:MAG: holo-ACP synthase [Actinomycetota bacterium]|nr:holo-ACP synthase [Actinomycetota bacterium]
MVGIDVVDIERLRAVMARSPGASQRLFTASERAYCAARSDPVVHFAGTLAAKEAVIKALGLGPLPVWARRIEVVRDAGVPRVEVTGADASGVNISISHDAGVAVAVAVRISA